MDWRRGSTGSLQGFCMLRLLRNCSILPRQNLPTPLILTFPHHLVGHDLNLKYHDGKADRLQGLFLVLIVFMQTSCADCM